MVVNNKEKNKEKAHQKGGVGYKLDVFKNCKIGGLPEVVATSDCPAVGPGDSKFAQAMYGGTKTKRKARRIKKRQTKKRGSRK